MSEEAKPLSALALKVLARAAGRVTGNICPTPELRGVAQTALLRTLSKRGLVDSGSWIPTITAKGRKTVAALKASA